MCRQTNMFLPSVSRENLKGIRNRAVRDSQEGVVHMHEMNTKNRRKVRVWLTVKCRRGLSTLYKAYISMEIKQYMFPL